MFLSANGQLFLWMSFWGHRKAFQAPSPFYRGHSLPEFPDLSQPFWVSTFLVADFNSSVTFVGCHPIESELEGKKSELVPLRYHGCWETFYIFDYCCLVVEV